MSGSAPARGLKGYLGALVATVVFPLVWMRSMGIARRHRDADSRGPAKVAVAIVAGVLIALGGTVVLLGIQAEAKEGMYEALETRLASATGESAYQDNVVTIETANNALPIIERNLAAATAEADRLAADPTATPEQRQAANQTRDDLAAARTKTADQRTHAERNVTALTPNHQLFLRLQEHAEDQDDSAIRAEVRAAGLATPEGMAEATDAALAVKDGAVDDMRLFFWLFLWPSLAGAFFAPLAFALGSVLKAAYEESDTVGYKPYPGAAAGWFLLFGAFGVPAIPFAAWVFMDAANRSVEGQIAL